MEVTSTVTWVSVRVYRGTGTYGTFLYELSFIYSSLIFESRILTVNLCSFYTWVYRDNLLESFMRNSLRQETFSTHISVLFREFRYRFSFYTGIICFQNLSLQALVPSHTGALFTISRAYWCGWGSGSLDPEIKVIERNPDPVTPPVNNKLLNMWTSKNLEEVNFKNNWEVCFFRRIIRRFSEEKRYLIIFTTLAGVLDLDIRISFGFKWILETKIIYQKIIFPVLKGWMFSISHIPIYCIFL